MLFTGHYPVDNNYSKHTDIGSNEKLCVYIEHFDCLKLSIWNCFPKKFDEKKRLFFQPTLFIKIGSSNFESLDGFGARL